MIFGAIFYLAAWVGLTVGVAIYLTEKNEGSWKWRLGLVAGVCITFAFGVAVITTG